MSRSKHRRLGLAIIVGVLVVAFFASTIFAGIATSLLGATQSTICAGLGSCPLGFQSGDGSISAR